MRMRPVLSGRCRRHPDSREQACGENRRGNTSSHVKPLPVNHCCGIAQDLWSRAFGK
jgi:hypothetical protein